MSARTFSLGAVLSVVTHKVLCPFGDIHKCIEFVCDMPVWTHQIPRATEVAGPGILLQHPQLQGVDGSEINQGNALEWLAAQEAIFGRELPLSPLPPGVFEAKHPVDEAVEMMEKAR